MPSTRPFITLLTDFGSRDCFVASMKGVILSVNPAVEIVDLSHAIAPHQVDEAGYFLKSCFQYFPEGTIHVAVVDPGVGTDRRGLLISTGREFFIGPDNGLFSEIFTLYPYADVGVSRTGIIACLRLVQPSMVVMCLRRQLRG